MIHIDSGSPTSIRLSEERFRIYGRLRFSDDCEELIDGIPLKQRILDELHRQFSHENPFLQNMIGNDYDFPQYKGKRIKIAAKFEEVSEPPYVHFHYFDTPGICMVPMFVFWRLNQNKHVFLFSSDIRSVIKRGGVKAILSSTDDKGKEKAPYRYSATTLAKLAAHEFGHTLGINDLYGGSAPYAFRYRPEAAVSSEMPQHDIMRTHFIEGDWYSPNDLEMAWMAQEKNAPQSHVALGCFYPGLKEKSEAVRLAGFDPTWKQKRREQKKKKRELARQRKRDKKNLS